MKGLAAIFILISNICLAQAQGPIIEGSSARDCYTYALELFTKHDTSFSKLSSELIRPATKTIYILKTKHVDALPDSINGYAVVCLDADSNKKLLYTEQVENNAVILYLDRMHNYNQQHNFSILPVRMLKKRRKRIVGFDNRGYVVHLYFDGPINSFRFDRTVYFDYTGLQERN